jgi:hypothetical protein
MTIEADRVKTSMGAGKVSIDRTCCSQAGLTKVQNSSCKAMLLSASPLGNGEASCAYYVRVR